MNEWLDLTWYHNTVREYLTAAGVFIALILVIQLVKRMVLHRLKKWSERTATTIDDFIVAQTERLGIPMLYLLAAWIALDSLTLTATVGTYLHSAIVILLTMLVVRFVNAFIRHLLTEYWNKHRGSDEVYSLRGISGFVSVLVWVIGTVFILDNLGFKVSTIVAGLGIGGIAVALAAQTILSDLFSYIVIFFDRPFQIGDFIVVDDKVGAVENIGIKTTRIKSLSGEQLVFSNKDLTNSRIHNFKKMVERRVVFSIGVTYQTSLENLKNIPELIKSIVQSHQGARFDRAHFFKYADSSLVFEIVYYVFGPDYNTYMDIQQSINLRIFEEFERRKIEFAYPTRTVFLNRADA